MLITSLDNKKIKEWRKLHNRKYREETGKFLVEGEHLVLEAYKKGCIDELILDENESFKLDVNTTYVSNNIIKALSSLDNPSSVLAVCKMIENNTDLGNHILVLDSIQDPGNLGTIIRSAVAFNINTIILGNNTVDVYNAKCIRASQGMLFHINIVEKDLLSFLPTLKEDGFKLFGTKVDGGRNLKDIKKEAKHALIMGNEGNGVNSEILSLCDDYIYIKMKDDCESLNVAIACSIILYQLSE